MFISTALTIYAYISRELAVRVYSLMTDWKTLHVEMKVGKMSIMLCMRHCWRAIPSV
jgi:hypothetical protein